MIAEKIYDLLPSDWPKVIGDLPAAASDVVGILEYDGAVSTEYFGLQNGNSVLCPIVKVVSRSTTYEIGQARMTKAKELLHRYHDEDILSILLVSAPIYLGRTVEKMYEFQVTFRTQIKE